MKIESIHIKEKTLIDILKQSKITRTYFNNVFLFSMIYDKNIEIERIFEVEIKCKLEKISPLNLKLLKEIFNDTNYYDYYENFKRELLVFLDPIRMLDENKKQITLKPNFHNVDFGLFFKKDFIFFKCYIRVKDYLD